MKNKSAARKKSTAGPRKKSRPTKSEWHFDHIVQDATEEKMDRIWDAFIVAVEKEGLVCGGSYHPIGVCKTCRDLE